MLAWTVFGMALLAEVASGWMEYVRQTAVSAPDVAQLIDNQAFGLVMLASVLVGAVIVSRADGHLVGWLFMAVSLDSYYGALDAYANLSATLDAALPAATAAAWLGRLLGEPGPAPVMLLFLVFPTGRLPSRRWRWLVAAVFVWVTTMLVGTVLTPGPIPGHPTLMNPTGLESFPGLSSVLLTETGVLPAVLFALCLTAVVVRFRRARTVERQQLKFLLLSAVLLVCAFAILAAVSAMESAGEWSPAWRIFFYGVFLPAIASVPAAAGIAILRYRLYDIDRLINRTVGYAVVVALLAGLYLGLVIGLGATARAMTGESGDLVVALSTLAVAAAFQPVRRRVQATVDRRFNRSHYDAVQTIDVFGRRLRDEVSLEAVIEQLRASATATVRPAGSAVVMVGRSGSRR